MTYRRISAVCVTVCVLLCTCKTTLSQLSERSAKEILELAKVPGGWIVHIGCGADNLVNLIVEGGQNVPAEEILRVGCADGWVYCLRATDGQLVLTGKVVCLGQANEK